MKSTNLIEIFKFITKHDTEEKQILALRKDIKNARFITNPTMRIKEIFKGQI